jgi:hypothetical protein
MRGLLGTIATMLAIILVVASSGATASAAGQSPQEALESAQRDLEQALATF